MSDHFPHPPAPSPSACLQTYSATAGSTKCTACGTVNGKRQWTARKKGQTKCWDTTDLQDQSRKLLLR